MSRVCSICGKGPSAGRTIARRGRPKYLGGIGLKITGVTKRVFKPNIQKVWAMVMAAGIRFRPASRISK